MLKKTFKIPDMTCSNCAMVIEYDEAKLTDEQIIAAVKKKGYTALPA